MTSYHIPLAILSSMTDRKAGKGNTPPFSDPQVDGSMTYSHLHIHYQFLVVEDM